MLFFNLADRAVVSAGSAVPTAPASLVQDPHLGRQWRTLFGLAESYLLADFGSATAIELVALFGTTLSASTTWRVRLSTADAIGVAGDAYDSGLVTAPVGLAYGGATILVLPAPVTARYLRIDLADEDADQIAVGRLVAGLLWRPTYNYRIGYQRYVTDASAIDETPEGHAFVLARAPRRGLRVDFGWVTADEVAASIEPAMRHVGRHRDILLVLDTASTDLPRDSVWGQPAGPLGIGNPFRRFGRLELDILERGHP